MLICSLIFGIALASSIEETDDLIISHPASSKSFICLAVFTTSEVLVLVIDCTLIGLFPPIKTLPTLITLVFFLSILSPF